MHYVKTKREAFGLCNICSKEKSLSWDHVPPKGGINLSTMEMENLFNVFTTKEDVRKIRESQNGLKYRTICKECNEFLGRNYDPTVNEFALTVGRYLKSNLIFPKIIHHKTKPLRLIKGILGHLLAAKAEYDDASFDVQVRDFILDIDSKIPDNIHVFYWIYPYDCTIILRDFGMPSVRGRFDDFGFFQTLKYFPMAYLVSDKPQYEGLQLLTTYKDAGKDQEIDLPIALNRIKHHYWPEMVDDKNLLFGGQAASNSVSASPKIKNKA